MPEEQDLTPDSTDSVSDEALEVAMMSESELDGDDDSQKSGDAPESSPDNQDDSTPQKSDDDEKDEQPGPDQGADQTPAPDESTPGPVDEVDAFLNEMTALKEKSEKDKTDEYKQRLQKMRESDPLRARLWEEHNRIVGLQQGFTSERQKRREYERKLAEREKAQRKAELEGFKVLSSEEQEELKVDDPDAYVEYKMQEKEIESRKEKLKDVEATEQQREQFAELNDFIYDQFGFELGPQNKERAEKVFPTRLAEKVEQECIELFGEGKVYTAKQLKTAYNNLTQEERLLQERINARHDLANGIDSAANGGQSRLDRANSNNNPRRPKKADDVSLAEMQAMGPDEFESFAGPL